MKLRLLVFSFLCLFLPSLRAVDLSTLIPEDTTFYGHVPNVHAFDKFSEHPLARAFTTPELKKLFAPFLSMQEKNKERADKIYKEETGLTMEEAQAAFNGAGAVGMRLRITDMLKAGRAGLGGPSPASSPFKFMEGVILYEFKGDEATAAKHVNAFTRLMKEGFEEGFKGAAKGAPFPAEFAKFPEDYSASTEDYAGARMHLWKVKAGKNGFLDSPGWALVDNVLVLGLSERSLQECLDQFKKRAGSLAESPRFRPVAAAARDSAGLFYVDLHSLLGTLIAETTADSKSGRIPPQIPQALNAIGLDKFDAAYAIFNLKGVGADLEFGITFHDKPALMEFIALDGPGTPPDFIPVDADSVSWGTADLNRMFEVVLQIVADVDPDTASMVNAQLDTLRKNTGVDIKKDLLAHIGREMWSASAPLSETARKRENDEDFDPELENESNLGGIKLKDRKAFELALDSLINALAPGDALFEKRDLQGYTVKTFKEAPVSYVITDDWVILNVGPQDLLEKVLARLKKGGGGEHLLTLPHVQSAIKALPGDDDGTSYMDFEAFVRTLLPMVKNMARLGAFGPDVKDNIPEKVELPLVLSSRTYKDAGALRVRLHLEQKAK